MDAARYENTLIRLYGSDDAARQAARYSALLDLFSKAYGAQPGVRLFSAPGRSEICGNHTDHQHGRVLACAVTLDILAAAVPRADGLIRIRSLEYPELQVSVSQTEPHKKERGTSMALVRGVAAYLKTHGYAVGGFDAVMMTGVPKGSGLSSSAAYSVLLATILSGLYNGGAVPCTERALAGQWAENHYFGKPSGLMDQLVSATGGVLEIDFLNPAAPVVTRIPCSLQALGYVAIITNAGGSHAKLTGEYASIPADMGLVSAQFGKTCLREVDEAQFYEKLPALRTCVPDRALIRAMHFFSENARVPMLTVALKNGTMDTCLDLINESGRSSLELLQNVNPAHGNERSLALALALSERILSGRGAWRVHGGGFAGTIQAFAPLALKGAYIREMEQVFGKGCCYALTVRQEGGVEVLPE